MIIYGLKTCDTCRKALKTLGDAAFVDVRAEGIPKAVLEQAVSRLGDDLINKRSTTWRQLKETDRALGVAELIQKHPTVMKRPLIEHEGTLYLGWTSDVRGALGTE